MQVTETMGCKTQQEINYDGQNDSFRIDGYAALKYFGQSKCHLFDIIISISGHSNTLTN